MPVVVSTEDDVPDALADRVEADADLVLDALGLADAELSVLLCGDATIAPLNRDYRGKDQPTDVLSFSQGEDLDAGGPALLGDVVISVDTAARQAAELGHDLDTELRVLLVHGVCHLLGHDHHAPEETAAMRAEEARLLAVLADRAPGGVGVGAPRSLVQRSED